MINFADTLDVLMKSGVRFILIGGFAGNLHGSARITYDLDILYERTPENYRRLVAALSPYQPYLRGAPPGLPFRWDEATIAAGLNFTLSTTLGDVDVLGEIIGGGYRELIGHTVLMPLRNHLVPTLDLPTLISVKRRTGRNKDLEAIGELEQLLDRQPPANDGG
ncbi:MAG: hypothetical protein SH850_20120 [Planctomycetaceae bacterium]|nr:hypothetical protein [Planctomycetaceae bacterium]